MLFSKLINLISVSTSVNSLGDSVETPTSRQVMADEMAIGQTEFYQAAATGLRPEIKFLVWEVDYSNEPKLEYNSKTYNIIRTYKRPDERIELTAQGLTNGVM